MINYDNMLDCVAADCLAHPDGRLHLSDEQIRAARETSRSMEVAH